MAVHFDTNDAAGLLAAFDPRIMQKDPKGKITTWEKRRRSILHTQAKRMTMDALANLLEVHLGKPIVNATNLSGLFDFSLPFSKNENETELGPDLEKLGLGFHSSNSQIKMLIVDPIATGAATAP